MSAQNLRRPSAPEPGSLTVPTGRTVHVGECLAMLKAFPDDHFDCCLTSPPYYFVRDYQHPDQIGLERSPVDYVMRLADVFDEVRRVLKPTGTLWVIIDDSYCTRRAIRADGKRTVAKGGKARSWAESAAVDQTITGAQFRHLGIKEKDLFLIPEAVARQLRRRGWYLRAKVIWAKSAIVPEKAADRPSRSYESIFMLTKAESGYTYNARVLAEQSRDGGRRAGRDVWEIPPSSRRSSHTATMPEELARRCILTSTNPGDRVLDPFAGVGTTGIVASQHGRYCDLIELNPEFAQIARNRLDLHRFVPPAARDAGLIAVANAVRIGEAVAPRTVLERAGWGSGGMQRRRLNATVTSTWSIVEDSSGVTKALRRVLRTPAGKHQVVECVAPEVARRALAAHEG